MPTEPEPSFPPGRPGGRFYEAGGRGDAVFTFRRIDHKTYCVTTQFDYVGKKGHSYRVPGDVGENSTDLASIPGFLTWLVPKDGRHTPAAVLHDALIGGRNGKDYVVTHVDDVDDGQADLLFREAMAGLGVAWLRRWMMWAAVALRTLTMRTDPETRKAIPRWGRIVPVAVVVLAWTVVCALMALDVPDVSRPALELPWLGDRPFCLELLIGFVMIVVGAAGIAVVLGLVLWSARGIAAGAIAGAAIGLLALPMLASAIGFAMYVVLSAVLSAFFDRGGPTDRDGAPYEITVEPDASVSES